MQLSYREINATVDIHRTQSAESNPASRLRLMIGDLQFASGSSMAKEARPNYQPFPLTPWSLVDRAAASDNDDLDAQRAFLNELLQRYLPALRAHLIYGKRLAPDAADDLLQSFVVEKVVESDLIGNADR